MAHRVSRAEAWQHVGGVTAANDFGLYDLRYADPGSNVHSKDLAGCTPLGPVVMDAQILDPASLRLQSFVNGRLLQDTRVDEDMLFDFSYVIADLSRFMTLQPGDLILTGTPAGSSLVTPGDVVEIEVSGLDLLGVPIDRPTADTHRARPIPDWFASGRSCRGCRGEGGCQRRRGLSPNCPKMHDLQKPRKEHRGVESIVAGLLAA